MGSVPFTRGTHHIFQKATYVHGPGKNTPFSGPESQPLVGGRGGRLHSGTALVARAA